MLFRSDYISDKRLSHVLVGDNTREEEGAIRTKDGFYQIYLNGKWNDIVINFVFREDGSSTYELEHTPVGFDTAFEVMSGNSNMLGIDGKPIYNQYKTSMGAYQPDIIISGGTF